MMSAGGTSGVQMLIDEPHLNLLRWMKCEDFSLRSCPVRPATFPDTGRGMMTRRPLNPGDVIISIPEKLLITPTYISHSYLGHALQRWLPHRVSVMEGLAIFLMCERCRGNTSSWHPYIQSLPSSYTDATWWSEQQIHQLPDHVEELARLRQQAARDSYQYVQPLLQILQQQETGLTDLGGMEMFLWAWSSVNTRCVHLPLMQDDLYTYRPSPSNDAALAPLLDLLNHSATAKVEAGLNMKTDCYEISTLTPVRKGEQVFIGYGSYNNSKLAVEYGFTLPVNHLNSVPFTIGDLEVLDVDKMYQRMKVIHSLLEGDTDATNRSPTQLYVDQHGPSWTLQTALGILTLPETHLLTWRKSIGCQHSETANIEQKRLLQKLIDKAQEQLENKMILHVNISDSYINMMTQQILSDSMTLLNEAHV